MSSRCLTLGTSDGRELPARLRLPAEGAAVRGAAVLCHPHPLFGGSMDVWLLPRLSQRLSEAGWAALRFDFRRDVGDGGAALPDVAAAVDETLAIVPDAPRVALIGWSLGALVGLLHGPSDPRVTDWVGIAPPSRPLPPSWEAQPLAPVPDDLAGWPARRSVIVGDHEQFYPVEDAHRFAASAVRVVAAADHFFFDRDDEVADLVVDLLEGS